MTREGFSRSGRLGIQADWDWREENLPHPPLLPCACTLGTGYDASMWALPPILSSTDLFGGIFLVIELLHFRLLHLDKEVLWIRFRRHFHFLLRLCLSAHSCLTVSFT